MTAPPVAAVEAARPIVTEAAIHVEVMAWRPFTHNSIAGFVDLRLPGAGLIVLGCVLHAQFGRRWLSLPAERRTEGGAVRYLPVVRFADDSARDAFQRAALAAVDAYLGVRGGVRR